MDGSITEEKPGKSSNFVRYISNPKAFTLKKWFYDLLQMDYAAHDAIIERIATSLTTEKDLEDFGKLIGQCFQKGFSTAVAQYQKEAEKLGLKITIVPPKD